MTGTCSTCNNWRGGNDDQSARCAASVTLRNTMRDETCSRYAAELGKCRHCGAKAVTAGVCGSCGGHNAP